jgi:CheY-like chemotaxis protein
LTTWSAGNCCTRSRQHLKLSVGGCQVSLIGTRVFIVEDEALVLMTLEDSLAALGCEIVASASHVDDALAKAGALAFDVAILDLNLAGRSVEPVADLLARRGIPFVFASGYGRSGLPAQHRDRPLLAKPYVVSELRTALLEALAQQAGAVDP